MEKGSYKLASRKRRTVRLRKDFLKTSCLLIIILINQKVVIKPVRI